MKAMASNADRDVVPLEANMGPAVPALPPPVGGGTTLMASCAICKKPCHRQPTRFSPQPQAVMNNLWLARSTGKLPANSG